MLGFLSAFNPLQKFFAYATFALVGIIIAMTIGFKFYYAATDAKITALNETIGDQKIQISALSASLDAKNLQIESQSQLLSAQTKSLAPLAKEVARIGEEQAKTADVLGKHDLTYLATQKPGLIEKIINKGTDKVMADLEALSKKPTLPASAPATTPPAATPATGPNNDN